MNATRLILLTLGSWIVLISSALAEDQPRTARTPGPKAEVNRDAEAQGVRSARSLPGTSIKTSAGDEFGTIKDVGLDLDQARVTTVFVTPHDAVAGTRDALAIPLTAVQWRSSRGDIVFDAASKTASATAASPAPGEKSRVMRVASTGDIPVTNADGDHAGRVVDFGITPGKGAIMYVVFTPSPEGTSDETLYPIPLAAFVVPKGATTDLGLSRGHSGKHPNVREKSLA